MLGQPTMRIKCNDCNKPVSNEVADDVVVTARVVCPACINNMNEHYCKVAKWYSISVNEAQLRCIDCGKILGIAPAILNNHLVELLAFSHDFR